MSNTNTLPPELFNHLLKLPNIEITSIEQINDEIFIYVSSIEETANRIKGVGHIKGVISKGSEYQRGQTRNIKGVRLERIFNRV